MTKEEKIYRKGFYDGLTAFAVWKDGRQYVGDPPKQLREIRAEEVWNYKPPKNDPQGTE